MRPSSLRLPPALWRCRHSHYLHVILLQVLSLLPHSTHTKTSKICHFPLIWPISADWGEQKVTRAAVPADPPTPALLQRHRWAHSGEQVGYHRRPRRMHEKNFSLVGTHRWMPGLLKAITGERLYGRLATFSLFHLLLLSLPTSRAEAPSSSPHPAGSSPLGWYVPELHQQKGTGKEGSKGRKRFSI